MGALTAKPAIEATDPSMPPSPPWTQDLVIYLINPYIFTSPRGPGTGTFESLKAKLPYLRDLGVTMVWLGGDATSSVFPAQIVPKYGTPEQFTSLIKEAHRLGIRVMATILTHGLMPQSPTILEHPYWFRGGTWGMRDYDWNGGHTDLDNWWVRIWTQCVTDYGLDGFFLDEDDPRVDLVERIRQNAARAGHPIIFMEEYYQTIPGITDLTLSEIELAPYLPSSILRKDVPGFYAHHFGHIGNYQVELQFEDGSKAFASTEKQGPIKVHLDGVTTDRVSFGIGDYVQGDGIPDVQLTVTDIPTTSHLRNVIVTDPDLIAEPIRELTYQWSFLGTARWCCNQADETHPWTNADGTGVPRVYDRPLGITGRVPTIQLHIPTHGYNSAVGIYDWAKGSRSLFGYSGLFTPMIPIFIQGEEFNTAHLKIASDTEAEGSAIDWRGLEQPAHRAMLEDVRRMLLIRKQQHELLVPEIRGDVEPKLVAVPYTSDIPVPVPYMRWNGGKGIVIMGNPNTSADAHLTLNIPLDKLGSATNASYRITDLWHQGPTEVHPASDLAALSYLTTHDKSAGGGLGVLMIERVP